MPRERVRRERKRRRRPGKVSSRSLRRQRRRRRQSDHSRRRGRRCDRTSDGMNAHWPHLPFIMMGAIMAAIVLDPAATARADEPCARVVALTEVSPAWAAAVGDLRKQIARLAASECQAMTLSLEPQDTEMRIVAMTPDGRRTERTVNAPDSLVAVAMGLLMAVPGEAPATPPEPTPPAPRPSDHPPAILAAGAAPETPPRTIALWMGLSGGVRLTAPTALSVLDLEARADILLDHWLMLITLRSAVVSCLGQQGVDCDVYNDVSIGAGVGRRFRIGVPDVDLAFEPSLVVMHMEYDGAGAEGQTVVDTDVALRLDVSARLAVPVAPQWALTVTLDGGLAPSMLARPARLEVPLGAGGGVQSLPPFPAWSGGVRLGVMGELL